MYCPTLRGGGMCAHALCGSFTAIIGRKMVLKMVLKMVVKHVVKCV